MQKLNYGLYYTSSWGNGSLNKLRNKIGTEVELLNNLIFNMEIDYSLNYMNINKNTNSGSYIKFSLNYLMD